MTPEVSAAWNDPIFVRVVTYLAVFGALAFVGNFIVLVAQKRAATGWMTLLALLLTLALIIYQEFLDGDLLTFEEPAPPPAPKVEEPPPPPEPEPVAETPPEPEPEPAKPKKIVPYELKILEKDVQRNSSVGRYLAQGPREGDVEELIFGDAIQSAIWEFHITSGYSKFKPDWKKTLHEELGGNVRFTSRNKDPRGYKIRAEVNLPDLREGMFHLGFIPSQVRPRFQIGKNPTSQSAPDLSTALTRAIIEQSNYSLGGYLLTDKGLLKDEISHMNFFVGRSRYFVDATNAQVINGDSDGDDVLYTVDLTPGAAD